MSNNFAVIVAFVMGLSLMANAACGLYIWRTDSAKVVVPFEVMRGVK